MDVLSLQDTVPLNWCLIVYRTCVGLPESNGYIYVEANGGLNQQRTSVVTLLPWFLVTTYILRSFIYRYLELITNTSH